MTPQSSPKKKEKDTRTRNTVGNRVEMRAKKQLTFSNLSCEERLLMALELSDLALEMRLCLKQS